MDFKNIIFDFDGTLADTTANILATMHQTISELGLPPRTDDECRATIGLRLEDIPPVLWPEVKDLSEKYAATYRRIFEEVKKKLRVNLYPGVKETLMDLHERGVNMAIASSRNRSSLEGFVSELGMEDYFQSLIGGGDVREGKPSPEPVNKILEAHGWNPEETLTVGDMDVDILMGLRAGTETCGVTYGNGSAESLQGAGANRLIDSFSSLLDVKKSK